MKYIRTYDDYESYKAEYSDTSRGFRLKPTLYKYSEAGDHVHLELDDPRKHGDSTYMEITLDSDVEFSFYIGNAPGNTQTIRDCKVDWGDGDSGSTRLTSDDKGFKLSHNYKAGSYSIIGDATNYKSLISHPSSVKRVILGSGVVSIESRTFQNCSSLTSVYIPDSVTKIGGDAFSGCTGLTSVNIPESVTEIGGSAFRSCSSLTLVHIPESVTSIEDLAFYNCHSLTSAYIPSRVTIIKGTFRSCESLTSVHIPEGVTIIDDYTFSGCTGLTSVNIPESVTKIGGNAFGGCTGLTSVNIPESVTEILNYAFDGCTSLISISSLNTTAPTLGLFGSGQYTIFTGLPTNGTLHIKPGATGYDAWLNYLPEGWRIVEDL